MAVLSWISMVGIAVVASCYSPELRDCAVSCVSAADCAPEQVCGSDGMCAAPEVAGRCATMGVPTDAGTDSPAPVIVDGPLPTDAAPPIDAAPQRLVRIQIVGRGGVTVAGAGTCAFNSPTHPCTFSVPAAAVATLQTAAAPEWVFEKWEPGPCQGQGATCTFTPMLPLTDVKAKFEEGDKD